jgi:WD40 repeat protein
VRDRFSGGRNILVLGATIKRYRFERATRQLTEESLHGHVAIPVSAVAPLTSTLYAVGTVDGAIALLDTTRGQFTDFARDQRSGGLSGIAASSQARLVLTSGGLPLSSSDDTIRLWDSTSRTVLARFTLDCPARCCALNAPGTFAIVGDDRGRVHFFNVLTDNRGMHAKH